LFNILYIIIVMSEYKKESPEFVVLQVRIEKELAEILDDFCQKNNRSRSWLIRRALIFTFMRELGIAKAKKFYDLLNPRPKQ